jgi:hypothetical protein
MPGNSTQPPRRRHLRRVPPDFLPIVAAPQIHQLPTCFFKELSDHKTRVSVISQALSSAPVSPLSARHPPSTTVPSQLKTCSAKDWPNHRFAEDVAGLRIERVTVHFAGADEFLRRLKFGSHRSLRIAHLPASLLRGNEWATDALSPIRGQVGAG